MALLETEQQTESHIGRSERARADRVKAGGVHYTPSDIAKFLAEEALARTAPEMPLRVLDPACGDGALLAAIAESASGREVHLIGYDRDPEAIAIADKRLADLGVSYELRTADFLEAIAGEFDAQPSLFSDDAAGGERFDIVIANPPYVRTQTLTGATAQCLAGKFGLSGRVDLYHAFVAAMTLSLDTGGVLSLLCSNRFMTTKSGRDLRDLLSSAFDLHHVFDLGDTKIFEAAVLPAIVIGTKSSAGTQQCPMTAVYETVAAGDAPGHTVTTLIRSESDRVAQIDGRSYLARRGVVDLGDPDRPWVAIDAREQRFLKKVRASAWRTVGELFKIRVGIKTTADQVFIRDDWDDLGESLRPEEELLLPLITHHVAARWTADTHRCRVLYPYDLSCEKRQPLDLTNYPRTMAYLESHRTRLEGRKYVVEGGRGWWEIWVPQRPALWAVPKIVFPDIAEEPRFFLDRTGAVVNGDCYWASITDDADQELAALALAVANSALGTAYYDLACGNRLYSGRRRYITQYVQGFPLPDPSQPAAQTLVDIVTDLTESQADNDSTQEEIDSLVLRAFGIEEIPR